MEGERNKDTERYAVVNWDKTKTEEDIGFRKQVMQLGTEEFICRASLEKQTENRLMDMGRGVESVRCMERVRWKLTLPYIKEIANRSLLYVSGNSNRDSTST